MPKLVRSIRKATRSVRHSITRRAISNVARYPVTPENRDKILRPSNRVLERGVESGKVVERIAHERGRVNPDMIAFNYLGGPALSKMHRVRFAHRQDAAIRYALRAMEIPSKVLPEVRSLLRVFFEDPSFQRIEKPVRWGEVPVPALEAYERLIGKVGKRKAAELLAWCQRKYREI